MVVQRQWGKGPSEEAVFDLKNKKLPRRDLEGKCPKQQCSEGKRLGKRACVPGICKEAPALRRGW